MAAGPEPVTRREYEHLKRLLAEQQERIDQLAQRPAVLPETIEALGLDTPTGRRQAMKYGVGVPGMAALVATALAEPARADLVAADVGTQADPWRTGFFAALNAGDGQDAIDFETPFTLADNEISSATTIDAAQVVPYDCSVAGFTITLGSELAANGGWVVLIDETGSSGTNSMTVDTEAAETIDGGASITINHDAAITTIYWDGDEWRTTRFIDTVDARTVTTDSATIDGKEAPGFGTSSSATPGFDSWTQVDANRPAAVIVWASVETNGSNAGIVDLQVDESGGTTSDYEMRVAYADDGLGSAGTDIDAAFTILPPGAQYFIENAGDPNNNNSILNVREFVL